MLVDTNVAQKMDSEKLTSIRRVLVEPEEFSGWLYLPSGPWTMDTEGVFASYAKDTDDGNIPDAAKQMGWNIAVDSDAIEDVISNVKDQIDDPTIQQLFDAFVHYVDNDAFKVF